MGAEVLLARLKRVRKTGPDRWIASCPTREDRHPSLGIRELPDGRVLLHDFGGESPERILDAIGLTWADLYPDGVPPRGERLRRPFPAEDMLRCIAHEALLVSIAAQDMAAGKELASGERERLLLAVRRIRGGLDYMEALDA